MSQLTDEQRQVFKLKSVLKGENMSEVREIMVKTMEEIREGSCPLETAHEMHLAAHRAVMDAYADCRKERLGLRDKALKKAINAMDQV